MLTGLFAFQHGENMAKAKATQTRVAKLMAKLEQAGVVSSAGKVRAQRAFATGIDVVDHYLFACGGFPAGQRALTELYGAEGSAKSALVDTALGNTQRNGGAAFLADSEHARDEVRSSAVFGVDFSTLGQYLKDTDDESLEAVFSYVESTLTELAGDEFGALIAWDSYAGTPTRDEVAAGTDPEKVFDTRAKTTSRALRIITPLLARSNSALVIVNQPRTKIGVAFGNPTTTPGGQAIKSTASLRVQMWGSTAVKVKDRVVGRLVTAVAEKSRFSQRRKVTLRFDFDTGFNDEWSTLNLAKDLGLVPAQAKGAKALASALEALAKHYPGFAGASVNKARAERADKSADEEAGEQHEPIDSEGTDDT